MSIEKGMFYGGVALLSSVLLAEFAHAGSVVEHMATQAGVSVNPIQDGAFSAKIGACTAVIQPLDSGAFKFFTSVGADTFTEATGFTDPQKLELKRLLGDAKMLDSQLYSTLENVKDQKILSRAMEFLKVSPHCNNNLTS
jgi:hypothetical protein